LLDLGFFKYHRFALIDENDGFFVSRLKRSANPLIVRELRKWRDRAIPVEGKQVFDVVGDLCREHIDVEVEVRFQRRAYKGKRSWDTKRFRVVGVRSADADDGYRLYVTNLPSDAFTPEDVATLYRARWVVELLFRELKSQYGLGRFQTEKEHIVRIQMTAVLLTLIVSRAIFGYSLITPTDRAITACFPPNAGRRSSGRTPSESSLISSCRSATTRICRTRGIRRLDNRSITADALRR